MGYFVTANTRDRIKTHDLKPNNLLSVSDFQHHTELGPPSYQRKSSDQYAPYEYKLMVEFGQLLSFGLSEGCLYVSV